VIGKSGLFSTAQGNLGFDITSAGGVDTAYAAIVNSGNSLTSLYSFNLTNGVTTPIGLIRDGSISVRDIAVALAPATTPTGPPVYQFATPLVTVPENGGMATLTVTRTGDTSAAGSVTYTITGGTAVNGVDYVLPATGQIAFAANETSKTITVPVMSDHLPGVNKTMTCVLSNVAGPGSVSPAGGTAMLTITETDQPPTQPPPTQGTNPFNVAPGTDITAQFRVSSTRTKMGGRKSKMVRITMTVRNPSAFDTGGITGRLLVRSRQGRRRSWAMEQTSGLGPKGAATLTYAVNTKTTSVIGFQVVTPTGQAAGVGNTYPGVIPVPG
jgi:hypothetical protein